MGARVWIVIGVLLLVCGVALADTGGSMGGGDWGGGGGDYSGGGGDYSSSYDSSYSSSGSSGGSMPTPLAVTIIVVIGIIYLVSWASKTRDAYTTYNLTGHLGTVDDDYGSTDVTVLRVALDGRARKFVQAELSRIAKTADTRTAVGRHAMLAEVTLMLRRVRDAWVYGGAVNEPMRTSSGAKITFDKHVRDARARFRDETIRNADGTVTTKPAPEHTPRSHEGDGLILVSIIVAARTELVTVKHIGDGEDLRKALEAASLRSPSELIAIEIVWQPSEDADRLSSIELEAKYPHPDLIPIQGALVGKTFCAYCSGPYPAELITCPHCGAPNQDRGGARAA